MATMAPCCPVACDALRIAGRPLARRISVPVAASWRRGPLRDAVVAGSQRHNAGSPQHAAAASVWQHQEQQAGIGEQQPTVLATKGSGPRWLPARGLLLALLVVCACLAVCSSSMAASAAQEGGSGGGVVGALKAMLSFALHLDKHLASMIEARGPGTTYATLFAIVFAETGLVLTPFLPGDSLLFAAGAFCALGLLQLPVLMGLLFVAAVLGDALNYAIGSYLGAAALQSRLVNKEYIDKTEAFFNKYGGKTIVLARFVPIVRTFAPFVAGVGSMTYSNFAMYNVGGAALWTVLFCGAGYLFGNLPVVQHNFTLVVLAIVAVSVVPVLLEVMAARREAAAAAAQRAAGEQGGGGSGI